VRKLKKAEVSLKPGRHAALGLDAYCQVTSPLRRYGDLLLQRQLHSVLGTGVACYGDGELLERMSVADETALEVRRLVRSAERYWGLVALREVVGREVEAVVLELRRKQAVVLLREFGVQGRFFPQSDLSPGARLALKVVHVDPRGDSLTLASPEA
jgi:exoribonuclease II